MGVSQAEPPQPGYIQLIEPSVQAIHQMITAVQVVFMVGAKLWIPTVHLEAGLRSGDRKMPEEINRLLTDTIADVLWTPSPDGDEHLLAEGVSPDKITRIGNIMLDSFELMREQIEKDTMRESLGRLKCSISDTVVDALSPDWRMPSIKRVMPLSSR